MNVRGPREQTPAPITRSYKPQAGQPTATTEALLVALFDGGWKLLRAILRLAWRHPVGTGIAVVIGLLAWSADHTSATVLGLEVTLLVAATTAGRQWLPRRNRHKAWQRQTARQLAKDWPTLCERVGLMVTDRDRRTGAVTESLPGLTGLAWSAEGTVLTGQVALVAGQLVEDLGEVAERIGEATGAHRCRITRAGPSTAELALLFTDPLRQVIPPLPIPTPVDLTALPIGLREDASPWLLRLIGTHLLVVGVTGAGKGSVIWSLLRALAPSIRDGTVTVWAVDGKAGMELAPGRALFTRLATTVEDAVDLLEDAVAVMTTRATDMAGHARVHTPTPTDPLIVVLVDEVALLTAYQPDRKLRERAEKALATIATQGRAPGVVLVAALQDPRKEVLGLRNLFPTKIGMRLDEKSQVDMVLGDGARDAGAACHQIPDTQPGVAYVKLDGQREPARVRASYLSDDDISALANTYRAPS